MGNKAMLYVLVAVLAVIGALSFLPEASGCSVDNFLVTNEGSLAANSPQALNGVLQAIHDDKTKLAGFVKDGSVLELKEGIKVEVLERSVEWKMLKIKLPNSDASYWVKDGSLRPIDCNK